MTVLTSPAGISINRRCSRAGKLSVIAAACFVLSGCLVAGPDYQKPDVAAPASFAEADSAMYEQSASSSSFTQLWQDFNDPALTALIHQGIRSNTDLLAAAARLEQSRALSGLSVYSLAPTVTASAGSERNRQSSRDPFTFPGLGVIETSQLQFDSIWEIDLFGSLKRQNQQIRRRVQADEALLVDVQRSVVAEIAQSYFALRGAQAQLKVQREGVEAQARTVDILQKTLDAGRGTALDVARARSLERSLAAVLPSIQAQISTSKQRLAVLVSGASVDVDETLHMTPAGKRPVLPEVIQLGTPEQWLQRRPDVKAAERQLAIATATIGVETAEFYPKLNLVGSFGYSGTRLGDIGDIEARRWNFGPSLQWRFLDYGRVRQYVRAAEAGEREAAANFQGAVLRALEDMENSLAGYRFTTAITMRLSEALSASAKAAELAQLRFDNGASNYLEVLDAERTRLDLASQHAQANTSRLTALVAVYKALAAE